MTFLTHHRPRVNPWPVPWGSRDEFGELWQELDRHFGWPAGRRHRPALDVHETDDAYTIEADLPGLKREDVTIQVADDVVTIRGERTFETRDGDENYHRTERQFGRFERSLSIPGGFDPKNVQARFEDGVLKVTLHKPEERKPRTIEVQGS